MISKEQFILRQPEAPKETSTDPFFFNLANKLVRKASENKLFNSYPEKVVERAALSLIGYYQDVICDAGIWRSFVSECRRLYSHTLPFYDIDDDYLDFELNRADVRFMVWYALSMNYEELRVRNPFDREIIDGADSWYDLLENYYDEAPIPEDYRMAHELEMHVKEDSEAIYRLGNWLFMHCYLMTPAYAMTLSEIAASSDLSSEEGMIAFKDRLEDSMSQDPTGPLALYLREWLYLVCEGRLPKERHKNQEEHKFFTTFTKATDGKIIKFFTSYEDLNRFLIDGMGWDKNELHFPHMKSEHDFILMVNREKGMLLAKNIARCIAHPDNPVYDKDFARKYAISLLTERGLCPGDLLKYVCENGWLPDAAFPGGDPDTVANNWDFIARCFLQQYYRGD